MSNDLLREIDDPTTSAERLQQIAAEAPELGAKIAAHPNCYPELNAWIERYAPTALPQQKPRRVWKAIGITAAVIAPLIAAASIVIPAIDSLSRRESSADMLKLSSGSGPVAPFSDAEVVGTLDEPKKMERAHILDWEIPVSAPIESFPLDNVADGDGYFRYCSDAQLAWLEEHASPGVGAGSTSFSMTLQNSSDVGASLPLSNIRFVGEEVPSEAIVRFICPSGGRGATAAGQPLLVKVTGEESLYGEAVGVAGDDVMPEGSPVTLNLSPGEISVVTLTRDESVNKQRRYEGKFVADVADDSGASVVLADSVVFKRAALNGFYVGFPSGQLSAELVCLSPSFYGELNSSGTPQSKPCSLKQAAAILQEAEQEAKANQ